MTSAVHNWGYEQVHAAAAFVRDRAPINASAGGAAPVGVVLGSGLGAVADGVLANGGRAVSYGAIPHFPTSSVEGHKGQLVVGQVGDTPVVLMQGRVHRYEGYPAQAVAFPIRVLHALGVRRLIVTNAAGGMGKGMVAGNLMIIEDHLNLTGDNPLAGKNDERFGPRFPDMSDAYTKRLRAVAADVGKNLGVPLTSGIYAGLLGPSYETPAEIRMLQTLGASAVGMSTVHEVITASHLGMEVLGISCITNLAAGISATKLSHDEVKETATRVERAFTDLILTLVPRLA